MEGDGAGTHEEERDRRDHEKKRDKEALRNYDEESNREPLGERDR